MFQLQPNAIKSQFLKFTSSSPTFSFPQKHALLWNLSDSLNTCAYNTHMHSCIHSCALLQQCTVAISPPLASSPLCDCYWKCSAATGASSWRIYMTQVHALESTHVRVHKHTHTHIHTRTHISGGTRVNQPAKTRSNVSHLMSTPLTSHNTLQTYTHTLTYVSELLRAVSKPG